MSDTPETDAMEVHKGLERERNAAREELARVREELIASNKVNQGLCAKLAEAERERDQAMMKFKELKRAAIEVLRVVPVAHCSDMHHGKRDMHSALEPCPVVDRYNSKIDNLLALLKEEA